MDSGVGGHEYSFYCNTCVCINCPISICLARHLHQQIREYLLLLSLESVDVFMYILD